MCTSIVPMSRETFMSTAHCKAVLCMILVSLWFLPLNVRAAREVQVGDSAQPAREVHLQLEDFENAWNRGDIQGVIRQYHPSVDVIFKSEHWDYAREVEDIEFLMKKKEHQRLRFKVDLIRALTVDLAVVNGSFHLISGDGREDSGPFTAIWMRSDGRWQCIYTHSL